MPIAVLILGLALMVAAFRGRHLELAEMLRDDFVGRDSFVPWLGAMFLLYLVGKIPYMEKPAMMLIWLVVIVLLLTKGRGFWDGLNSQIKQLQYS